MKRRAAGLAWMSILGGATAILTVTVRPTLPAGLGAGRHDVVAPIAHSLHILAAALAWYLTVTTAIAIAGRVLRCDLLAVIGDRFSLPAARFIVGSALGMSALSPVQVLAEPAGPTPIEVEDVPTMEMLPPTENVDGAAGVEPRPAPRSSAVPGRAPAMASVTVIQGDHLWSISAKHLEATGGRVPTDAEIAPYWSAVVELNTPRLASGDPDLIRPGEVIELPPVPANWAI